MAKVGEAWVAVHPNADGFFKKLTKQLAKESAKADPDDKHYNHEVKPTIDRDAWRKELDAWQKERDKEADAGKGPTQKVRVTPDDSEQGKQAFQKDVDKLAKSMRRKDQAVKVAVTADTSLARAEIKRLGEERVRVHVDVVEADRAGDLDNLQERIQRHAAVLDDMRRRAAKQPTKGRPDTELSVGFKLQEGSLESIRSAVHSVLSEAAEADDYKLKVGLETEGFDSLDGQLKQLDALEERLNKLSGKAKVKVEVDGADTAFDEFFENNWFDWKDGQWEQAVHLKPTVDPEADPFTELFADNRIAWDDSDGWHGDVKLRVVPEFDGEKSQLQDQLDELNAYMGEKQAKVKIEADVDAAAAKAQLDELTRDRRVQIHVDVVGDGVDEKFAGLGEGRKIKVGVDPDTYTELDDLIDKLDQARDAAGKLGAEWGEDFTTGVEVHVDVDGATAEAQLDHLTRDRTVHIRTVVDGAAGGGDVFTGADRGVVELRSDAATGRDVDRASAEISAQIDASAAKVAKKLDLPAGQRREAEVSQLKLASDMVKAQLNRLEEGENKFRPSLGELSAEYIKEQIARQDRDARAGVGPRLAREIRAYSESVSEEIAPAAAVVADEVAKIRRTAEKRVTRPQALSDRVWSEGHLDYDRVSEVIASGVKSNAKWTERIAREIEQAPDARKLRAYLKANELNDYRPKLTEHAAWMDSKQLTARYDAAVAAEEAALGKLGGASLANAIKGELSDAVKERADNVRAAQSNQARADRELRQLYDRVPGARTGRVDALREIDVQLYREGRRSAQPVPVKVMEGTPALDAAQEWFAKNRNVRANGFTGLGDERTGRVVGKESSAADTWINAVKKATVTKDRDSDFTYYLKRGMQSTLSAPAHLAKMAGRKASLARLDRIPDATGFAGVGKGIDVDPAAMSMLPKAGGMAKFAGVPGLAAQGALTGFRVSLMGGSLAAGIGVVTDAVAGLSAQLVAVSKPLGQTMLSVAAAPAVLAQVATSVGAVALSLNNIGTAFSALGDPEKFAEAMEDLTPAARDFMGVMNDMYEPFMQMRSDMQEAMFDGAADSFTRMSDSLFPIVQQKFPEMAGIIGDLGDTIMDTLASPQIARRVASTFDGMNKSLAEMQPGMAAFTEAIVRMVDVGAREALPALGRSFSQLGNWFNEYMSEGRITSWINTAGDGLREVGGLAKDLWAGGGDFFKAMAAGADASFGDGGVWGAMRGAIQDFRDFTASDVGQAKIADFFQGATDSAREVWDIAKQWGGAIVSDVIPAARSFLQDHGDTIGNLGEDLLQISGKMISSVGPMVEMIAGVVDGINEITGGPGSSKRNKEIAERAGASEKWLDENWDTDRDAFQKYNWKGEKSFDQERYDKHKADLGSFMQQNRDYLNENMASVDTEQWGRVADAMSRANFQLQALEGGFQGTKQSAEATASVMTMLGDKIVDIPDEKSLVIEADPNDRAVNALESIGAKVTEIEDQPGKLRVEFENEMEVAGAIDQLKSDMEGMTDAEIQVRGLDQALQQAVELKAQMDGMGDAEIAINVEAGQVDEVVAKLQQMGVDAQNINGSVYLDTNAPEVQQFLEEINAGKEINGQFVLDSNADEELAKVLGLDGTEIHTLQTVTSNADEVAATNEELAQPVEKQLNIVKGVDETEGAAEPEPVDKPVNLVEGTNEVDMSAAAEPVEAPVNLVVGDNQAQAEKENLATPTESQHTITANTDEVAGKKAELSTPTESQHTVKDNVPEVAGKIAGLNAANTNSMHTVNSNVSAVMAQISSLNGRNTTSTHTIVTKKTGAAANGGVFTPMATGGVLPQHREARMAPGGSYILWAENETGGESYIPHAPSKRGRSTKILAETAELFGLSLVDAAGNAIEAMANGGVKYANPDSRRLSEMNKQRARAEAYQKVEQQKLAREQELKEKQRKKELTPAEKSEAANLQREIEEVRARRKKEEDGYARAMTGYKRGQFVYTDVDTDHEEAVRSVDQAGLIPENIRISSTIKDWDEVDERSIGIIRALDNDRYATEYEPQVRGSVDQMEQWALAQGLDPAQVNAARRAVDSAMPLTDLPPEVQAALLSGEEVHRNERWHRDIDQEKLFKGKGSFEEIDWALIGKYLQGWYGDDLADTIGLNARIARDVPLYNLINPDDETWNAALGDIRGGRRHVERQYKDKYQDERKVMREAESDERDRQKARDAAERSAAKNPEQLRKELERELAKERDDNAVRAAGMNAVREHRAAMTNTQQGQGVVVNQTIGNITAADASEAAAKFRRKTMVGFENLTGVF